MSAPRWHESGWFAIALLVVFLGCMSQGIIALLKVSFEAGLDAQTTQALWIRFGVTAVGAAVSGGLLVRGILRPGRPDSTSG